MTDAPPEGQQQQAPQTGPKNQPAPPQPDPAEELRSSLAEERKQRRAAEQKLAELEREHMTETQRAIAEARAEGHAEAASAASRRLAAAEFRAAAAGKLGDADAALEYLDLTKFEGPDGEPDRKAINAAVERLAAAAPQQQNARVPSGPRQPDTQPDDFIRAAAAAARHGG